MGRLIHSRFAEYEPGGSLTDWSAAWSGGGSYVPKYDRLSRANRLHVTGTDTNWNALTCDAISSVSVVRVVALIVPGSTSVPTLATMIRDSAGSESGFYLEVDPVNHHVDFRALSSGTDSSITPTLGSNPITDVVYEGVPLFVQLDHDGSGAHAARAWMLGDTPGSFTVLSTSPITGLVGLLTNAAADDYSVLMLSATDGESIATELDDRLGTLDYLADTTGKVGAIVSVEVHDPSAGTTATEYVGTLADDEGPIDGTTVAGGLSVGNAGWSLEGDLYLPQDRVNEMDLRIDNKPIAGAGIFDSWIDKTLQGRRVRLGLGDVTLPSRLYSPYVSGRVSGEPDIDVDQNEVRLSTLPASQTALSRPYPVTRYLGQRTCLEALANNGGLVTVTHAAEQSLTALTIVALMRKVGNSSWSAIYKLASGTSQNYNLTFLNDNTVIFRYTTSGTQKDITTSALALSEWHTVVASLLPGVHKYVMVDGEILAQASGAAVTSPDQPTNDIKINDVSRTGDRIAHVGLLNAYTPPEQARSLFASRLIGSESNVVGLWRLDDESGTTAADQSANGNDGTIAGTEGVNWDYVESDLGEPELAGKQRPIVFAVPRQTLADRIDNLRERVCHNDGETLDVDETFRLRGTATAESSNADGVAEFGSTLDESLPLTVDHENDSGATEDPDSWIASEVAELVATTAGLELGNAGEHVTQWPQQIGIGHNGDEPTYREILQEAVSANGGSWYDDAYGRYVTEYLLPPVSPGPVETVCVECYGDPATQATTSARGTGPILHSYTSSVGAAYALGGWVRPLAIPESKYDLGSGRDPHTFFSTDAGYWLGVDPVSGALTTEYAGLSLSAEANALEWGEWQYIGVLFYDVGAQFVVTLHVKPLGGTMAQVAKGEVTASPSGSTAFTTLRVGGVAGGYQRVSAIEGVVLPGELDTLSDASDPTSVFFISSGVLKTHLPLSEGHALQYTTCAVTGRPVYLRRSRWAPKLDLDVARSSAQWDDGPRVVRPTNEMAIHYDRAWKELGDADIAGSVKTGDPNLYAQLTRRHSTLRASLPGVDSDGYDDAVKVEYDSTLVNKRGAEGLARIASSRFEPGRIYGRLAKLDRRFIAVGPGDEVLIESGDGRLPGHYPRSVRVTQCGISEWSKEGPQFAAEVWG